MGYNVKQLETVIIEDECDKKKKIIVKKNPYHEIRIFWLNI